MKKVLSVFLALVMLLSLAVLPVSATEAGGNWNGGTLVSYDAEDPDGDGIKDNTEAYTVTVPSQLAPGTGGEVVLAGTWASDRMVVVTADEEVILENSINPDNTKTLEVTFTTIEQIGDNEFTIEVKEDVSVEGIANAIFGTWSGTFNYNVEIVDADIENVARVYTYGDAVIVDDYMYVYDNCESYDEFGFGMVKFALFANGVEWTTREEAFDKFAMMLGASSFAELGVTEHQIYEMLGLGAEEDFGDAVSNDFFTAGWRVQVVDKTKVEYSKIRNEFDGISVTSLYYAFGDCVNMVEAPEIPKTVISLRRAFENCKALEVASQIPEGVTNMREAFYGCTSLTEAPEIPNSVINMSDAFRSCTSLTTAPNMSNATNVVNMSYTFYGCESLAIAPNIPASVTDMRSTFSNCTNLTSITTISSSVTNMESTFANCASLTRAPELPDGVINMQSTFSGCKNLTSAPDIPSNVTNMWGAFYGCTSLTGEISIPCSLASENYKYSNCPATITYYHVEGCDGSCGK